MLAVTPYPIDIAINSFHFRFLHSGRIMSSSERFYLKMGYGYSNLFHEAKGRADEHPHPPATTLEVEHRQYFADHAAALPI